MPAPTYAALSGPVSSLDVEARRIPATQSVKQEGIGSYLGKLGDFAGSALFRKDDKKKKPKTPLANQIYAKGKSTLQAYNALLEPTQALLLAAAEGDLEQFRRLAPGYVQAITEADPMSTHLRNQLNKSAMDLNTDANADFDLGTHLSPDELRRAQQASRTNRSGGGFGQGSEHDRFNEALDVATRGRELYQQRFSNLLQSHADVGNVARVNAAAVGDPLLAVTGRPSGVHALGDVPNDSLNLVLNEEQARRNKAAADAANRTQLYSAGISAVGSIAGGGLSAI